MCHKLPFPLSTRVFPVLVITAKKGSQGFVVVQVPVNIASLPEALYSNGRNLREGDSGLKRKKPTLGYAACVLRDGLPWSLTIPSSVYTSIERCVLTANDEIEWTMATASNARGNLPMWAQKMGVPGAVAKDVGFFMKWIEEKRANRGA